VHAQPVTELAVEARTVEIGDARGLHCLVEHLVDVEVDLLVPGRLQYLALQIGQLRVAQVINGDDVRHRVSLTVGHRGVRK
jgi:hypothetical protein